MGRWNPNRPAMLVTRVKAGRQLVSSVSRPTKTLAKRSAPRSPSHQHGSGKPRSGPRLNEAINLSSMVTTPSRVSQNVRADRPYATGLEKTFRAHVIRPRRKKVLKFKWRRIVATQGGRRRIRPNTFSYFKKVNHPGYRRRRPYLTGSARTVAAANNFKFTGFLT